MAEELAFRLSIEGAEQELRNIEDLRQAVRQLEENLETADFGSEAFKRAEKELKAARGELYKFDRQLEALEDPVKGAEKWVKYGEGIAGGFAAAQGAAAIFGVENENVEKMVVKAQGAVAVAMGARMLAESQLLTVLKESKIAALALDVVEKIRIGTTLASAAATRVLHAAMIAVGIGVVTGLVAVLVANWKNLTEGVKALAKQFVNLVPGMGKIVGFFGRIRDAVIDLGQSLNLVASDAEMATKRMAEAAGELADSEAEAFKKRKEIAQAAGEETLAMEEEHLRERVEHLRQAAASGNEERQKEYDDALHQLDVFIAAKGKREADATAAEKQRASKAAAERERLRQEELGRAMDLSRELDELFNAMLFRMDAGIGGFSSAPEEMRTITDATITERQRLNDLEDQMVQHASQRNKEQGEQIEFIKKKDLELRSARIDSAQVALATASNVAGSLSMLSQAFSKEGKKNEKVQKALAIAQIAIDTAIGISGAIKAGSGIPFPGNLAAIATGVASVLAGIASAKAALSKAGGGGGAGSTPSVNLPTFAPPEVEQRTGTATTAEGEFGGGAFGPARAYVVGSDVSSDMEARQRVEDLASLGG